MRTAHAHVHDDHAQHEPMRHDAHGHRRPRHHGAHEPHESPWVVTLPLILLAIPSMVIGFFTIGPMLFGTTGPGHHEQLPFFLGAIDVYNRDQRRSCAQVMALKEEFHGPVAFALHGFMAPAFWLAFAGFVAGDGHVPGRVAGAAAHRRDSAHLRMAGHACWRTSTGIDDLWIDGFAGGGLALGRPVARDRQQCHRWRRRQRQCRRGRPGRRPAAHAPSPATSTTTRSR